jgi:hypothetical protein
VVQPEVLLFFILRLLELVQYVVDGVVREEDGMHQVLKVEIFLEMVAVKVV